MKSTSKIFLIKSKRSFRFLVGREKDPENSEVIRLIQRSLQMDQERSNDSTVNSSMHQETVKTQREVKKENCLNIVSIDVFFVDEFLLVKQISDAQRI